MFIVRVDSIIYPSHVVVVVIIILNAPLYPLLLRQRLSLILLNKCHRIASGTKRLVFETANSKGMEQEDGGNGNVVYVYRSAHGRRSHARAIGIDMART